MKNVLLSAALCAFAALPAFAQDRFEIPVTAKVLPGWIQADGTRIAGLQLTLEPGWKTYWRAPGDGGIPPRFDWSKSKNLTSVGVTWPSPRVFDQNGMRSIGYENELVIPLTIAPKRAGKPVRLVVDMAMGICSDICVPHQISLDATLETDGSKPTPIIAAALAQRPFSATEAGVTDATCSIEPTKDGLKIAARVSMPSAGGAEVMVIEPGVADVWVSEAQTQRKGSDVVGVSEMINVNGDPIALNRSAIRLTVLGASHAVDIQGCSPG